MRVVGFVCPECKDETHTLRSDGKMLCDSCGVNYERKGTIGVVRGLNEDATPNDELRALVEEWREQADIDMGVEQHDAADRWAQAANQLEQLIEGATDE